MKAAARKTSDPHTAFVERQLYTPLLRGEHPVPQVGKEGEARIFHKEPVRTLVKLPRSGQGRTPRKGVYITQPVQYQARLQPLGKHRKQANPPGAHGKQIKAACVKMLRAALEVLFGKSQPEEAL